MNDEICPMCDGPSSILGCLGSRLHLRCRDCGSDWSIEVEPDTVTYDTDNADCMMSGE